MTNEEREQLKAFAQKFWSDPKRAAETREVLKHSMDGVCPYCGKAVITPEESDRRRREVGLPTHDEIMNGKYIE